MDTINQAVELPILKEKQITFSIKREDAIHPLVSGNKYRKLKYNLLKAKAQGYSSILTFGGAYSNHIVATAYAGRLHGFKTIGIIRGEELREEWYKNPSLKLAFEQGMQFEFVSRSVYRDKTSKLFLQHLKETYEPFFLIPEGGANNLGVKGCSEILSTTDTAFNYICTAVGTGGTLAGLSNAATEKQIVLGFSALKGDFLQEDIRNFTAQNNWQVLTNYHFGGYAKVTANLVRFINNFKKETGIQLDPIYTGKMFYGIIYLVRNDYFKPKTKILAVHTGGLQGITGMNQKLKRKNLPQLIT